MNEPSSIFVMKCTSHSQDLFVVFAYKTIPMPPAKFFVKLLLPRQQIAGIKCRGFQLICAAAKPRIQLRVEDESHPKQLRVEDESHPKRAVCKDFANKAD
jgi:hypothetical protein